MGWITVKRRKTGEGRQRAKILPRCPLCRQRSVNFDPKVKTEALVDKLTRDEQNGVNKFSTCLRCDEEVRSEKDDKDYRKRVESYILGLRRRRDVMKKKSK